MFIGNKFAKASRPVSGKKGGQNQSLHKPDQFKELKWMQRNEKSR